MIILMHIYILILKIIYSFMKLSKTKNRVVFLSRQSDKPSLDYRMINDEIKKIDQNIETVFITKRVEKNKSDVLKGFPILLKSLKYLATSKVCITDGYNIAISTLNHKKDLKVFQIWHSLGAIKKFGYQSLNNEKDKKIANVMKMHKNYNYINCSSESMKKYFSEAFNYDEKYLYPLSLPRVDYLITKEKVIKKKIYNVYPEFKKKKVILYAPTFRNNNNYKIDELIKEIDLNKYILIIKAHPNMKISINNKNIYTCEDFKTLSLLTVSDYVITDYSAVTIEASILNKPVYLYTYDLEEYKNNPGLNIDLEEELKGYVFENPKKLYESILKEKYNIKKLNSIRDKYITSTKGDITKNIAKFILKEGEIYEKEN